jgi:hypothetical protein
MRLEKSRVGSKKEEKGEKKEKKGFGGESNK